jgi:adenylate cyclase, class 2
VDKVREIYYIENVKFHIDIVNKLGNFVEIEAISIDSKFTLDRLQDQCNYYMSMLGIQDEDLLHNSYSDQLIEGV